MPIYDYKCKCGQTQEEVKSLSSIDECVLCNACGSVMGRIISGQHGINMGAAGVVGYYDQNLGKYIHSNSQRREEMKRQGVTEKIGKGWY